MASAPHPPPACRHSLVVVRRPTDFGMVGTGLLRGLLFLLPRPGVRKRLKSQVHVHCESAKGSSKDAASDFWRKQAEQRAILSCDG
jgi:hypothetical protein